MNTQALKFITCGSVDDGKSTLIGRLLVDSRSVLQDQLAGVQRSGETDLALLTDGLSAEREQGITIDVAYRYFSTPKRKFIIGDAPGHEQYTRNMVTAASSADAAVVLVDASKLKWDDPQLSLLAQTRRHSLLLKLLRVPHIVVAINKLDMVPEADAPRAFANIKGAIERFALEAGITLETIIPISALLGWNVVTPHTGWCGYGNTADQRPLLDTLEDLGTVPADTALPFAFPVQWVEKFSSAAHTDKGRRVLWGRIAAGQAQVGQEVTVLPSGQTAVVADVLNTVRGPTTVQAGHSAGIVLDREVDVSRGDWLLAPGAFQPYQRISATIAWMDDEPLVASRVYWALHGHRWVKAKVAKVTHRFDINSLQPHDATTLAANEIGDIELAFQEPLATLPFSQARQLGSMILVDTASHKTSGAVLVQVALPSA
jgi:sulfate adenylyltransferase subunit 1